MSEPENIALMLLREIRREIAEVRDSQGHLATNLAVADLRKDMAGSETRLKERISGLQRAVMEYHSSTIGHGVLISEFEDRLRRVEQHLKITPTESH